MTKKAKEVNDAKTVPTSEESAQTPKTGENEASGTAFAGAASSSMDLGAIAQDLASTMPDVQEHAINAEQQRENDKRAAYADLKDTDGNSFDPSMHKTNAAGEPSLSTKGKLIKKPGRKPGQTSAGQSSVGGVQGSAPVVDNKAIQARTSGKAAANVFMGLGVALGGDEWKPIADKERGIDEREYLETVFADYFEATGKTDIPPGWALTIGVAGYALPRLGMPKTQARAKGVFGKIKLWWINRKLKKHGVKAANVDNKAETMEA